MKKIPVALFVAFSVFLFARCSKDNSASTFESTPPSTGPTPTLTLQEGQIIGNWKYDSMVTCYNNVRASSIVYIPNSKRVNLKAEYYFHNDTTMQIYKCDYTEAGTTSNRYWQVASTNKFTLGSWGMWGGMGYTYDIMGLSPDFNFMIYKITEQDLSFNINDDSTSYWYYLHK